MSAPIINEADRLFLEQYSRAEITRAQLAQRLGCDLSAGEAILLLRDAKLTLPQPKTPGAEALRTILAAQINTPHAK
ncbi:MAG: hypothetical protein ACOYJ6_01170 [Caulobacterales bacterium]|jgi:hypothetical protein